MILPLRKCVLDFVDNGIGFNAFALPLEVEKNTMTKCGEQHGIDIRKSDVVTFIEEGIDFGGECYRLDTPNPRTEVDVAFDGLWRVLGIGVCTTDESDDVAFDMPQQ